MTPSDRPSVAPSIILSSASSSMPSLSPNVGPGATHNLKPSSSLIEAPSDDPSSAFSSKPEKKLQLIITYI